MGIPLWDLDQLVTLVLETYDSLGENIQELVPLKQIWVLDDSDAGEDS